MAANKRIYWAVQAVAIAVHGYGQSALLSTSHIVRGLQSAGITSTFNLEQVFEMGQLSLYENIQEIPVFQRGQTIEPMFISASGLTPLISPVLVIPKHLFTAQACMYQVFHTRCQ